MKNVLHAVKILVRRNYDFSKWLYLQQLKRRDRHYPYGPLLVHQMGKVGSTSVTDSLRVADTGRPVYHVHFLADHLIRKYEQRRAVNLGTDREGRLRHVWQSVHLRKQIDRGLTSGADWKVVSLVRDPVARNLSNFFELLEVGTLGGGPRVVRSDEYGFEIPWTPDVGTKVIRLFFDLHDPLLADKFFEREIQGVYGVDVFEKQFDPAKGYQTYVGRGLELLVIQMERLNHCFDAAIADFLGVEGAMLHSRNFASDKSYAELYELVRAQIVFPDDYLKRVYGSRTAKHFYGSDDLARFRSKWQTE